MRAGRRVATAAVALLMLGTLPLAVLAANPVLPIGEALVRARGVLELAWLIAAAAAGEALRQAERRADEAERTREETARRRADEERLHIARELHDSLTHQISVITVQAGAAVHLARKRGEPAPDALLVIQAASREAGQELRATLEALRDDRRTRPHGLDQLPNLVDRARATGLDTTLSIEGDRLTVPTAVDRTVYRIVQESLTNIDRHASATSASVRLVFGPDRLAVHVDDDGRAGSGGTTGTGVGLLGMRERVTALGGSLRAGPSHGGGFAVHAELPVERVP
ncbi:sensor histidine kinase [Microlunatus sp. Y2014]|uniref:sensor histidine kinase n=1 Tax=Microlunatus sp. Y2014 TaxID=3418488 RepID=UPI003DA728CA